MPCSFEHEDRLAEKGIALVAGVDEAGRGPLAGPVIAAAVILPRTFDTRGIDDSKKIPPGLRRDLCRRITGTPGVVWAFASRDHTAIDRMNILRATHEAMREAFLALHPRAAHALIDGRPVPDFPAAQTAIVGGDRLSLSVAAASIVAKVLRDEEMERLDRVHPEYGFARHKGYPTPDHLAKLRIHGPCPVHRRSYAPVAQAELL